MFAAFWEALSLPFLSLINGFADSNLIGKLIVLVQIAGSIVAVAVIIGKKKELGDIVRNQRRFMRDFLSSPDVLDYYLSRKRGRQTTLELIYARTCERMVKLLSPDVRAAMIGLGAGAPNQALSVKEIELVRGCCEHVVQEEDIRVEHGMGVLATIVTASPMLGLLGTVWGVLEAFGAMGSKGTVLISEIAPSISSALLTTVAGLLVAIPCAVFYNSLAAQVRQISTDMVGFADELLGRIACEYQGRDG